MEVGCTFCPRVQDLRKATAVTARSIINCLLATRRVASQPSASQMRGTSRIGLLLCVVAGLLLVLPAAAARQPLEASDADPIATALAYSSTLADGGAREVILATSETFADSLASGLIQGQRNAPLLLTSSEDLDGRVRAEFERLGTERVIILGGVVAISSEVERQVADVVAGVDRVAGDNRITTALAVADFAYADTDAPWPCPNGSSCDSVIITRAFGTADGEQSRAFADALGAGAASAARGYPVLLTPTQALDPAVARWMTDRGVRRVIAVGGPAAISPEVEAELSDMGLLTLRAAGPSRVGTAVEIGALTGAPGTITVVQGEGRVAWASGLAAARDSPGGVLLVTGETVPPATLDRVFNVGDRMRCGVGVSPEACRLLTTSAAVDTLVQPYEAWLDAGQVVPPTSATSSGIAAIWRSGEEALCATLETYRLSGHAVTAQIRQGAFGENGPVAVSFEFVPNEFGTDFTIACTMDIDPQVMHAFTDAPQSHYLDVRTDAFPTGEVRGQVFADQPAPRVNGFPNPDEVVPGPGDPAGVGGVQVVPTGVADELCYRMELGSLDPPATLVHIHRGEFGRVGEVVFSLDVGVGSGQSVHCDRGVDAEQRAALQTDPQAFYVDVHNDAYPDGAIRGQMVIEHASSRET